MKIDLIAGARPNFVKIAAIIHALETIPSSFSYRLIHTGQHYDDKLSADFFRDLNIPLPAHNLDIGSGSTASQTGGIMMAYEQLLLLEKPDICLVVGDVTSSMACAITAKKMQVKVAHIEAGLRSFDWKMPEEINRVLIDSIADFFFTTTKEAKHLLLESGKNEQDIFFVGNTMIDTLLKFKPHFRRPEIWNQLNLEEKKFLVLTLHRPDNVDDVKNLERILNTILSNVGNLPVIFPVHPRTAKTLKELNFIRENLHLIDSLGYLEFNYLVERSKAILTDSGGITEEASILQIPCLTLRENTERPETVTVGTNKIVGTDSEKITEALDELFNENWKKGGIPDLWDGNAGIRIANILSKLSS